MSNLTCLVPFLLWTVVFFQVIFLTGKSNILNLKTTDGRHRRSARINTRIQPSGIGFKNTFVRFINSYHGNNQRLQLTNVLTG